jgi:hypothetical protein
MRWTVPTPTPNVEAIWRSVRMELGRNPSDRGNLSDRHVLDHSADATNVLA